MPRPEYYGFRSRRAGRRRSGWHGSMRLGALFAILVGINVYVFFFRGGTSIQDVLKTGAISRKAEAQIEPGAGSGSGPPGERGDEQGGTADDAIVLQGSLKGHLGLSTALAAVKLEQAQVNELIEALRSVLNMRGLQPTNTFEVRLDPVTRKIRAFTYHISPIARVEATRGSNGRLKATRREQALTTKRLKVGGKVASSLFQAVSEASESSALASKLINLFNWDINWYTDPREGDEFRVIVEKQYLGDKFYRYGKVVAAEYRGEVGRFQAFHFVTSDGEEGHFSPEGRSVRRTFLKTPLNFRRISSKFNHRRFHPVLHKTKGHFGVDYAAPRGTPVWAAADGKVLRAGRSGGAGNLVVLLHSGGIVTQYMHLSRFAAGLRQGGKIRQRQLVGYVGSTGLSTGPHLHYGISVNGRPVDPLRFKIPKGLLLPRRDRIRFLDQLPERMSELEGIPLH